MRTALPTAALVALVACCVALTQACSSESELIPVEPSANGGAAAPFDGDWGAIAGRGPDSRPEDFTTPAEVDVDLWLENGALSALAIAEHEAKPINEPAADHPLLRWQLTDPKSGQVTASGLVADPRVAIVEFDETGVADRALGAPQSTALFQLTVPNTGGRLRVSEASSAAAPAGAVLGEVDLVPSLQRFLSWLFPNASHRPERTDTSFSKLLDSGQVARVKSATGCALYSILIVGDGFQAADQAAFDSSVAATLSRVSSLPGYKDHWDSFEIYAQRYTSKDSGISDLGDSAHAPVVRDTAFRTSFNVAGVRRCVLPSPGIPSETARSLAKAKLTVRADSVVIIANSTDYGGCALSAQGIISMTRTKDASAVLGHELGHSLLSLKDEYTSDSARCNVGRSIGPNIGNDLGELPWASMLTTTQLPTTSGGSTTVGAFEGANYCPKGVYRPSATCFMRDLGAPFCPVCACRFDRAVNEREAQRNCPTRKPLSATCAAPDSCDGKADGNYCSQLSTSSGYACRKGGISGGHACPSNQRCTGFDANGQILCR